MTLPSIPGLPDNQQPGASRTNTTGLPDYNDIPTQSQTDAGSPTTPGSTEWWQAQLGDLYGQNVLIGIEPTHASHGNKNEGHGRLAMPEAPGGGATTDNKYQTTQDLFKSVMALASKDPQQFMQVQGLLYDSGAYGGSPRTSIHWGQWTTDTAQALKEALRNYEAIGPASGSPITWSEYLQQAATQGRVNQGQGGVGGAGAGASGSQTVLTDPNALRATLQQAAMQSLDRALTPDELSKFVTSFQSQQGTAQQSTASEVTSPDASAQAQAFVEQEHPGEFQQHNATAYSNALLNLFLPGGSQLANFTPNASIGGSGQTPEPQQPQAGGGV